MSRVLALPEVRKELLAKGALAGSMSAPEFGAFIRTEQQRWTKLMKDAGIVLE